MTDKSQLSLRSPACDQLASRSPAGRRER